VRERGVKVCKELERLPWLRRRSASSLQRKENIEVDWYIIILIFFLSLIGLMLLGFEVAFCFMLIAMVGAYMMWQGPVGLEQLVLQIYSSVTMRSLMPLPPFILMGEIMFQSGTAGLILDTVDKWTGRIAGRLSLIAVATGTLFGCITGSSSASCAMLGSVMTPEMAKRGYAKSMSLGPIPGSGSLAMMIPPSGLAILVAAIGEISVAKLLVAIIFPGLCIATLYIIYIMGRCTFQPHIAPKYAAVAVPLSEKLRATLYHIVPLSIIIFLVIGVMLLGWATPSEAASSGAVGCFIVAALHRRLTWEAVKKAFVGTMHLSVMLFLIVCTAQAFSQMLSWSGASIGFVTFVAELPVRPLTTIILMVGVLFILGMFMPTTAMIMIGIPFMVPVVKTLGFDTVWFGVLFMLSLECAVMSPPYGINLFIVKQVGPPGTTIKDVYLSVLPFLGLSVIVILLVVFFPQIALFLPGLTE